MTDDPRLKIMARVTRNWFGDRDQKEALSILAELDAVDPLRRPVSQDRVEAAMDAYRTGWREDTPGLEHKWRSDMARALAAADRVQAPAEPEAAPTADGEPAWNDLVRAAVAWAEHMDQWTKFQFPTKFGNVFVTISRMATFPDEFTPVTPNDTRPAEKPDFPPWSREMAALMRAVAFRCLGQNPTDRQYMTTRFNAAFPETRDERS